MIDYGILDQSVSFYESRGFTRIEAPWTVSEFVDDITRPKDALPFKLVHNNKHLVASGEQSFLYLYLKGFLPAGRYQTITPCFRFESFDFLHTKYFMKNELIITDRVNHDEVIKMVNQALDFFRKYLPSATCVITENGYDIAYEGIELGSYGIRRCDYLEWIYGTGCAEPRLSSIVKRNKIQK